MTLTSLGPLAPAGSVPVTLNLNGPTHRLQINPRATVPDTLRESLKLTGTKRDATTDNVVLAPFM